MRPDSVLPVLLTQTAHLWRALHSSHGNCASNGFHVTSGKVATRMTCSKASGACSASLSATEESLCNVAASAAMFPKSVELTMRVDPFVAPVAFRLDDATPFPITEGIAGDAYVRCRLPDVKIRAHRQVVVGKIAGAISSMRAV